MTWVLWNGAFLPSEQARIAVDDAGLLYGHGLFETFRAREGAVLYLEQHWERLRSGAELLSIPLPLTLAEVEVAVRELVQRCDLSDARVRLTLTAGSDPRHPVLLIQARGVAEYPEALYEQGMSAVAVPVRRNETSPLSRVKSLNYLDNLLARQEAQRLGADEALLLNTQGHLAEGSTTNIFLFRRGELRTPTIDEGALPGVTRGAVLELARGAGILVREGGLSLDDLRGADEAFLTNAVMGVMPLSEVNSAPLGGGRPGALTLRLRSLFPTGI